MAPPTSSCSGRAPRSAEGALQVRERFTDRSGVRIRYLDNDPQPTVGLPVLLTPGVTDTADEYKAVLEFLAPRRMLVVEVRGRGASEAPPTGYRAEQHANDLRAALDDAGIDRFHLMTFSRGTTWGLDLLLHDPTRVATVSIGDYWAAEKHLDESMADTLMATRFRGRPMTERVEPHVLGELFRASSERDLFSALATTTVPVLVARGTEPGGLLDDAAVDRYQAMVPGVEFAIIPGASHDLFRPDRLAYPNAVLEFINRRSPGK
jgi:pimeloyl-ACP methyl ester carboxylesterase